jgi:biuret amidohydrolase
MADHDDLKRLKLERIEQLHRCDQGQPALIVVDMQRGFLDPGASLEVPLGRAVSANVRQLVAICRKRHVPVIFTQFVYADAVPCLRGDPFGPEHLPAPPGQRAGFGRPSSNCLIGPAPGEGSESADIVDELAPAPGELVIHGYTYDKFYGTPLDLALRSQGVDRLILTGVTTDVCVNSTLIAAANRNYRVTAISDGMATIDPRIHDACLTIWRNKFARVRGADQVAEELAARE